MKRVVVTGSLGYDYIMDFPGRFADRIMPDKIHVISLSFLVNKLSKQLGGCATNLAYSLKLLGIDPYIVTAAGKDFDELKEFFNKNDISTDGIKIFKNDYCSNYHVVTDRDDNQIGAFYIGASRYNNRLSISSKADFVTIGPTDPKATVKYISECRNKKVPYFYDPAYQIASFSKEELQEGIEGAQILAGNDYEISLIEQKLGVYHQHLLTMCPIVITTLGSKGSIIETRNDAIHIKPAKPKSVVDPTGAGDAYRAGFLAGFLRGLDLQVCGQMGSVAAAYTVEKYGTVTHFFTKKEFEKRYYDNYAATIKL